MSNIFETIVNHLLLKDHFNSLEIARDLDMEHDNVIETIKLIHSTGDYFIINDKCQESWNLTKVGLSLLEDRGKKAKFGYTMKVATEIKLTNLELDKETYFNLNILKNGGKLDDEEKINLYEFKKFIEKTSIKCLEGEMINKDALKNLKIEYDVTDDVLKDEKWKTTSLMPYNFDQLGKKMYVGSINIITELINNIRRALFDVGFKETLSPPFIENPFWCNEALMMTDLNLDDMYEIKNNINNNSIPREFFNKIKIVNKDLFNNDIVETDTFKPILINNLNNILIRLLYKAAKNNVLQSYQFVIGKIISNKECDILHLPEYHAVAILLIGNQLKFNNIIGLLATIFEKLKIENVEYRPAYSSFTEPTLESICYHFGHDQWIRIGKSGMVRPEIMKAMDLIENNINALAITIIVERIAMVKNDAMDINQLK